MQLAKTLGVSKLLVVVKKMDDPTMNWSKERCFAILLVVWVESCNFSFINFMLFFPEV